MPSSFAALLSFFFSRTVSCCVCVPDARLGSCSECPFTAIWPFPLALLSGVAKVWSDSLLRLRTGCCFTLSVSCRWRRRGFLLEPPDTLRTLASGENMVRCVRDSRARRVAVRRRDGLGGGRGWWWLCVGLLCLQTISGELWVAQGSAGDGSGLYAAAQAAKLCPLQLSPHPWPSPGTEQPQNRLDKQLIMKIAGGIYFIAIRTHKSRSQTISRLSNARPHSMNCIWVQNAMQPSFMHSRRPSPITRKITAVKKERCL